MKNPFYKVSKKWFNDPKFIELMEYQDRILLLFQESVYDENSLGDKRKWNVNLNYFYIGATSVQSLETSLKVYYLTLSSDAVFECFA